jgi:hypothetical protein
MTQRAFVLSDAGTALCVTPAPSQLSHWLQLIQAVAAVATTVGVLTALYIAMIREPRNNAEEHRHHVAQLNELHRVKEERAGAQARKVVPHAARTPMFGETWWTVRIENGSNALTTLLRVDVHALNVDGLEVAHGCKPANGAMTVDQALDRSVRAILSESLNADQDGPLPGPVQRTMRDALVGHIVDKWPSTIAPSSHAVMAYTTTDPNYKLSITIDYEDQAGYQWRRTDISQPKRLGEHLAASGPNNAKESR